MEHYIVVHAVSDQPIGETFQRLFNTAEDAKKFAIRVADSYKVDYPDAKITVSEDSVRVDYQLPTGVKTREFGVTQTHS